MSLDSLRAWVGKTQITEDLAAPYPVRAMSATLDESDPEPRIGDPLPPLWHWLYFLDTPRQSKIGPDGHPERGDFLPPVPLPRRMWAGSRFTFDGPPLQVGDTITRKSEIKAVEPKSGSTGAMVFVIVRTPKAPKPSPADATWSRTINADPVLLFRYSALTFNGHRIHYDYPYVTGTEGYPGLIVHGPLLGTLQMELARRSNPTLTPKTFEFRALSPVFAGAPFSVHARREADGALTTWIADAKGGLSQQGKATFEKANGSTGAN